MQRRVGLPAGEESGSDDDWDVGYQMGKAESSGVSVPGSKEDQATILKRAISTGDVQLVEQLLDSDQCTVLMTACTALASEDDITKCVELLLSRNADPNMTCKSGMTTLMMAAKNGYCKVMNLLVSHGAKVNLKDFTGYTALMTAVQYGQEEAVMKLLQLGADKKIRTRDGRSALELAQINGHTQISRLLMCPGDDEGDAKVLREEETLSKFFRQNLEPVTAPLVSSAELRDIELLLHGLHLEHLSDVVLENGITLADLSTMEMGDLEKLGITDPADQKKLLTAVSAVNPDSKDLDTFTQLENTDTRSEDLYSFLLSLQKQCCCLTEVVQDANNKFPKQSSELILTLDPNGESQAICSRLMLQIADLQKEVACMRSLFDQMHLRKDPCRLPPSASRGVWKRRVLLRCAVAVLAAGLIRMLWQARSPKLFL